MNGSAFDQRPKTQDLKVLEWTDNVTHIRGRHILKGGVKIRRWLPHFTDSKQYQGVWTFNGFATQNPASPTGTGDAFADFMLGDAAPGHRGRFPLTPSAASPPTGTSTPRTTSGRTAG